MEVNGLGAMYINDFQMGGGSINRDQSPLNGAPDFAEHLRKAAAAQSMVQNDEAASSESKPHSAKIAVIDKTDKLYEQCMELEIFLIKTLLNSMRNTVQKSGLIDEGFAGKMYEDMLYDEYARDFAQNANFGMAEMAYLELTGQRGKTVMW